MREAERAGIASQVKSARENERALSKDEGFELER